ncbi:MAG: hypothetical protein JXR37_28955 [Kiritimatiellae bacterium]|nr:hypothetical protein [Kiritimatiellia bacterium]
MSETLIMGVDGGATKTECAVCTLDGEPRALTRGGPSNHEAVGYETAARTVGELVAQACAQAGTRTADIAAACFAMAGLDLPPDRDDIRRHIVDPLGLGGPVMLCNDAFAGFRAGSPRGMGVCVSLGSGITFCGCNDRGDTLQFEYPKPENLERRVRNALSAEYHGIGPACGFRDAYLAALGVGSLQAYFWTAYTNRAYAPRLARGRERESRDVLFRAAYHEDPALCLLLRRYAEEIADILIGLAGRLQLRSRAFDLVLSGSQLTKGRHPAMNDTLIALVQEQFPTCEPILVDGPPVQGAIRIAAETAGKPDRHATSYRANRACSERREHP